MGKNERKRLPIGISNFKEIIENDYYYVDKTNFIENILEEGFKVELFTRPRRFGKTLNISMLRYFFDVKNKEDNRKLFESLNISKSEYFEEQGNYPVISISFRNYGEKDWENGIRTIKTVISNTYDEHKIVMDNLDKRELKKFEDIWLENDEGDWKNSLLNLTKNLYEYYGKNQEKKVTNWDIEF